MQLARVKRWYRASKTVWDEPGLSLAPRSKAETVAQRTGSFVLAHPFWHFWMYSSPPFHPFYVHKAGLLVEETPKRVNEEAGG